MVLKKVITRKSLAFSFFLLAYTLSAQTGHWEKLNPPVSPSARTAFGMCQIGERQAILFGGYWNGANLGDTWIFNYNSKTWSKLITKNSPPNAYNHIMCKLNKNTVLMFGGEQDGQGYIDDTWLFNLSDTTWTKLELNFHPQKRVNFGMTEIADNFVLLFGGRTYDNFEVVNDTWLFDLNQRKWICIDSVPDWWNYEKRPFNRIDPAMASVEKNGAILFGGLYSSRYMGDTWFFDLNTSSWKRLKTKGWIDSVRGAQGVNLFKSKLFFFGGLSDSHRDTTLIFDLSDTSWSRLDLNLKPKARTEFGLAKIEDGIVLLFGGESNTKLENDTWLFRADINNVSNQLQNIDGITTYYSNGRINIQLEFKEPHYLDIEIIDIYGRLKKIINHELIQQRAISFGSNEENLSMGIYFIIISIKNHKIINKVIIY